MSRQRKYNNDLSNSGTFHLDAHKSFKRLSKTLNFYCDILRENPACTLLNITQPFSINKNASHTTSKYLSISTTKLLAKCK